MEYALGKVFRIDMFHDLLFCVYLCMVRCPRIHQLRVFDMPTQERLDLQKRLEAQSNEVPRAAFVHCGTRCNYGTNESCSCVHLSKAHKQSFRLGPNSPTSEPSSDQSKPNLRLATFELGCNCVAVIYLVIIVTRRYSQQLGRFRMKCRDCLVPLSAHRAKT